MKFKNILAMQKLFCIISILLILSMRLINRVRESKFYMRMSALFKTRNYVRFTSQRTEYREHKVSYSYSSRPKNASSYY